MEELQDAIEDIQYLTAVNSKAGPTPTEPWVFPKADKLDDFWNSIQEEDPDSYDIRNICGSLLGFYEFGRFCAAEDPGHRIKFKFVRDIVRFKRMNDVAKRRERTLELIGLYLHPGGGRKAVHGPDDSVGGGGSSRRGRSSGGGGGVRAAAEACAILAAAATALADPPALEIEFCGSLGISGRCGQSTQGGGVEEDNEDLFIKEPDMRRKPYSEDSQALLLRQLEAAGLVVDDAANALGVRGPLVTYIMDSVKASGAGDASLESECHLDEKKMGSLGGGGRDSKEHDTEVLSLVPSEADDVEREDGEKEKDGDGLGQGQGQGQHESGPKAAGGAIPADEAAVDDTATRVDALHVEPIDMAAEEPPAPTRSLQEEALESSRAKTRAARQGSRVAPEVGTAREAAQGQEGLCAEGADPAEPGEPPGGQEGRQGSGRGGAPNPSAKAVSSGSGGGREAEPQEKQQQLLQQEEEEGAGQVGQGVAGGGEQEVVREPPSKAMSFATEIDPEEVTRLSSRACHGGGGGLSGFNLDTSPRGGDPLCNRKLFDVLEVFVFEWLRDLLGDVFRESPFFAEYRAFVYIRHQPVKESDFILFRVLGRGGFGAVNGCKHATTGKLYAMKVMLKARIKQKQAVDLCINERRILAHCSGPFLVSLKYAFASKQNLFLVLDLMTGGDLGFHLSARGHFDVPTTKYYIARTVLALHHLHKQRIVYRDLKPENILLDETGRSRISDMGLACRISSKLVGSCGTRGYWAPEMRRRTSKGRRVPYDEMVDWFSMGCVVYELRKGSSPFRTERAVQWGMERAKKKALEAGEPPPKKDKDLFIDLATQEMEVYCNPDSFDKDCIDLIQGFLKKDPAERLGRNFADITGHPFLKDIDWDLMRQDLVQPPFVPDTEDINAAPQRAIGSFATHSGGGTKALTEDDHSAYKDWDFVNDAAFSEEVVDCIRYREEEAKLRALQVKQCCCAIC